jgi:hypothetical protein
MFTGSLEDRMAIQDLHARYSDAVVRNDTDDWGACWAEEAHWNMMGTTVKGRDAIVTLWTQAMGQYDAVSFISQAGSIEIDGDTGKGRTQTHEMLVQNGMTRIAGGLYRDTFVKRDGEWLYASRDFGVVASHDPEQGETA